nr:nitrate reductase [Stutzerimonas stutzeri]
MALPNPPALPRLPVQQQNNKVNAVPNSTDAPSSKSQETRLFLFLLVFLFPLLSIALVGGYGFIVWISQLTFLGPPGPLN